MMITRKMDNINIFDVGEQWASSDTFACVLYLYDLLLITR